MIHTSKLYTGWMLALCIGPALAQQQLERVEITGSSIKRVQAEGVVPIEIYKRKDIERTGATTGNELLRSIATVDLYEQGELAPNSPVLLNSIA